MNFKTATSPYLRNDKATVKNMMRNVCISLVPITLVATYFNPTSFILTLLVSLISILGVEYLYDYFKKTKREYFNYPALITSLIFALIVSQDTPLWVVFIGGLVSIIFGKIIFGGLGQNIYNPAAVGRAFILISFASLTNVDTTTSATALSVFNENNSFVQGLKLVSADYNLFDVFIGNTGGTYGETSALAILIGAAYLLYTKAADYKIMLTSIVSFTLMLLLLSINKGTDYSFVLYQLFSGGFLFGAVFMLTDPVSGPSCGPARYLYALLFSLFVFIIRFFGAFPEGVIFAILLCNTFAPLMDHYKFASSSFTRNWTLTVGSVFTLMLLFAVLI